jgi:hypothetical protein
MDTSIGVDIGSRREGSAICVVECASRPTAKGERLHYVVRHLERLPAGWSYPAIAARVGEITAAVHSATDCFPDVFVDATGLGEPIMQLLREHCERAWTLTACYFNHGDQRVEDGREVVRIGKAFLVTRLQTQLQARRLHLPRTPEAEALAQELIDYEVRVEPDANPRQGAFRVGTRDDLVTALGLAIQMEPRPVGFI